MFVLHAFQKKSKGGIATPKADVELISRNRTSLVDDKVAAVDCTVPAGGVAAMRPLIVHASSKAESDLPRRVLHIEYAPSLDLGDGVRLRLS